MQTDRRQPETQRPLTGEAFAHGEVRDADTTLWLVEDDSWQPSIRHLLQAQFQAWRNEAEQVRTQRV